MTEPSSGRFDSGRSVGVAASIGPGALVAGPDVGTVVGTGSAGFYVQVDDTYLAVLARGAPPGPIHIVLHGEAPVVAEGEPVRIDPSRLITPAGTISLARAARWDPDPLSASAAAQAVEVLAEQDWDSPPPADLAQRWPTLLHRLATGDDRGSGLADAFRLLAGRGGGLTPTGDDVLAGLLLADAVVGARLDRPGPVPTAGPSTIDRRGAPRPAAGWPAAEADGERRRLADEAATSTLSRSFLHWAALGMSIEPVHEVLAAAAVQDRAGLRRAARAVSAVGSSSGAALLAGLCVGCRFLPRPSS